MKKLILAALLSYSSSGFSMTSVAELVPLQGDSNFSTLVVTGQIAQSLYTDLTNPRPGDRQRLVGENIECSLVASEYSCRIYIESKSTGRIKTFKVWPVSPND